jgi:glycosyltransferase involved in cell wall biosynthesis
VGTDDAPLHGGLRTRGYRKQSSGPPIGIGQVPSIPLISIVTVTFNAAEHIEQTIRSVLGQSYDNVEYIIIDGGSTDSTVEIIRRYSHAIDFWISEPDGGIYDAMNKGVQLASGYYVGLLNAADWYDQDLLKTLVQTHIESGANDQAILYTDFQLFLEDLDFAEKRPCTLEPWKGMTISHQAMFVGAGVYRDVGLYDVSYRLAADYDFFLRAFSMGVRFVHSHHHGVYFRAGGRSAVNKVATIREAARALRKVYGGLSRHHARYVMVEGLGLLYYKYFQRLLIRMMGAKNVNAIRKLRRRIHGKLRIP